ncbi:hypothetical protein NUU61_007305 [Penicillium alfredii]|uniref:HhH-GPD domain-containing protein n=1 Tax=Penicillium alfredii TaxID=1506179 RepID=A0A9W9F2K1_9EURO|nr:uncharacterized protein NUU61_007305 [Penicillium alfredii]KAJ5092435.1 hypothetical protein NUU61_007305 [Penicillium alfredii]
MVPRVTRAAARAAAALLTDTQPINPPAEASNAPTTTKRKRTTKADVPTPKKKTRPKATASKKQRKKQTKPVLASAVDELPHNLGPAPVSLSTDADPAVSINGTDKENQTIKEEIVEKLATELQQTVDNATQVVVKEDPEHKLTKSDQKGQKKPKRHPYGLTPGQTPFPDWVRPTTEECEEVNRLLSGIHGEIIAPKTLPEPSLTVTGCGEVPSVLDALIRTLLSGATTGNNSAMAFNGLVQRFGILTEGIGKGSVNWDAVRQASLKDVFEAIKSGGLADIKSKNLKAILDMVHQENQQRRNLLVETGPAHNKNNDKDNQPPTNKVEKDKQYEIACADQNFLSLNHLHNLSSEEVMVELVKYPGIGPKTAACVLLFCFQRPCFAVDTHIFRICKWLGWVPPTRTNEVTAFSHLEVRIPDRLKYSLHQLLIRHGKTCPRCRAITGESSAGWDEGCVIDHLVTRTGKRKGAAATEKPQKNGGKKHGRKKRKTEHSESSEASESMESEETEWHED